MGQVFLGSSPGGRKVAVKIIRPEYAGHPQFRHRFAREVAAARQVGGFHTAQVVDADPDADPPWMVTAYIPGPSLLTVVGEGGPLDPDGVRFLGAGLVEGLAAIHACGLVHRDLKPGNVIMADDGPRIIDFGIARAADASALTSHGAVVGTFAFMSPEQVRADQASPASDVFSFGCVLVFAATGHGPFDAGTIPAIVHRIISQPPDLAGIPDGLRDLVAACLAKDPADRPGSADILAWLTESDSSTAGPPPTALARKPRDTPGDTPGAPTADRTSQAGERTALPDHEEVGDGDVNGSHRHGTRSGAGTSSSGDVATKPWAGSGAIGGVRSSRQRFWSIVRYFGPAKAGIVAVVAVLIVVTGTVIAVVTSQGPPPHKPLSVANLVGTWQNTNSSSPAAVRFVLTQSGAGIEVFSARSIQTVGLSVVRADTIRETRRQITGS
jgi:serine/threonine protein kinase